MNKLALLGGSPAVTIQKEFRWPIIAANAVPVFADIDPRTLTLDPADVRRRITSRTRAIMVVHLWGHPAAMDELNALAREHNLVVVEDASHAHGGMYKGRKVGTLGEIGVFSLQVSKALPAGEGGLLVTNRREYFERALLLAQSPGRLHLHLQLEEHRRFKNTGFSGFKYRINPVNAVIARQQMEHFEERNEIRQRNMDFLTEGLRGINGIRPPYTAPDVTRGGYYGYPIEYKSEELDGLPKETFLAALQAEGVEIDAERYPLLHLEPMFAEQNPVGNGWPWSFNEATRRAAGGARHWRHLHRHRGVGGVQFRRALCAGAGLDRTGRDPADSAAAIRAAGEKMMKRRQRRECYAATAHPTLSDRPQSQPHPRPGGSRAAQRR